MFLLILIFFSKKKNKKYNIFYIKPTATIKFF